MSKVLKPQTAYLPNLASRATPCLVSFVSLLCDPPGAIHLLVIIIVIIAVFIIICHVLYYYL